MKPSRCKSCDARIAPDARICERCGRPTALATSDDLIAWDLRQWREHRGAGAGESALRPSAARPAATTVVERPSVPKESRRRSRAPRRLHVGSLRRSKPSPAPQPTREKTDDVFRLRACPRCEGDDWLVRLRHDSEFDRWTYLCLRCVRDFASEHRLRHSRKPFIAAGVIIAFLLLLPTFL